jgi:putative FmdB family regulatory protein
MPSYDYLCSNNHVHEVFCSISSKPATKPCPECGAEAHSIITKAPHVWKNIYILDYPGSKALKAGYVHSHGDPGVQKVSVGPAGQLNPKSAPLHPLAESVQPDPPPRSPGPGSHE